MTRRAFSVTLTGVVAWPGLSGDSSLNVTLQAIAGAHLPATLTITTNAPGKMRNGLWELRRYTGVEPRLESQFARLFPRAGIRPLLREIARTSLTYLIPFDNLAARERAWTELNTNPAWTGARPRFQSYHFALYRVA